MKKITFKLIQDMGVLLTISQVAEITQLSKDHIYRVTNSGELGSFKIGRAVRISQEQLENWLKAKRQYTKYERIEIADTHVALN